MSESIIAAFFVISLVVPVLAVVGGFVALAWPVKRVVRTVRAGTDIPAHV